MTSLSHNNYDVIDIFCGVFLHVYFGPLDHNLSTSITQLSVDEFEFRFHKKLLNGHRSPTKVLKTKLCALGVLTKGFRFVFVFAGVTSTSRHA